MFVTGPKTWLGISHQCIFAKDWIPYLLKLSFLSQVAELSQRIDPRIVEKIHALAGDSVRDVNEMRRHIHVYVQNSRFLGSVPPLKSNKRFCPSKTTLQNHMDIAVIKQRPSKPRRKNKGLARSSNMCFCHIFFNCEQKATNWSAVDSWRQLFDWR